VVYKFAEGATVRNRGQSAGSSELVLALASTNLGGNDKEARLISRPSPHPAGASRIVFVFFAMSPKKAKRAAARAMPNVKQNCDGCQDQACTTCP
jgi:hypothetical protein